MIDSQTKKKSEFGTVTKDVMSSTKKKHIEKKHLKTDHGCFSGLVTLRIGSLIGVFFGKTGETWTIQLVPSIYIPVPGNFYF